ncbi:hypothetical protein HYDPIDRAFT_171516 [Hydnomerulius pinastri MD-312]|uniref:Uncharacterized protein n=1 Tax=Hydnomerulius pinastri MD-312 TaxID=994086 RepID=A0A0C9UXS7_9AGAM|nr:hypothetical protein HYDPIDRAFT_171516 [Hydnomerulius pinastri MD-312]
MIPCPAGVPVENWEAWPDNVRQIFIAGLAAASQPNPGARDIDPALTASGPRRPHDADRDGPTSPYPYRRREDSGGGHAVTVLGVNNTKMRSTSRERGRARRTSPSGSPRASLEDLFALVNDMRDDQDQHHRNVEARLTTLEQGNATAHHASATRGRLSIRGGLTRQRRRALPAPHTMSSEESRVAYCDEDAEEVTQPSSKLSAAGKKARHELKRLVTMKFRHICAVPEGAIWPTPEEERVNKATGEHYLLPEFKSNVNDEHNRVIFAKVAHDVWEDLQNMAKKPCLENRKVKWDKDSLFVFAKDTYRGFKEEWNTQNKEEKKIAKAANQRGNRWTQRRNEKANRLLTVCKAYEDQFGINPVHLVHADHMSDEGSGAEDGESDLSWKKRMAAKAGFSGEADLDGLTFMELGNILHDLHKLWRESLANKKRKRFHAIRVSDTGRQSGRIPDYTPYNFGINQEWLDANQHKHEYQDLLKDWGSWGDPEGWGSRKHGEEGNGQEEQGEMSCSMN